MGRECSLIVLVPNLQPDDSLLVCILFYSFQAFLNGTVGRGLKTVYKVQNLLPGDCKSGLQSIYKVSEPTSRELSAWVESFDCPQGVQIVLFVPKLHPGECLLGIHSFCLRFPNHPLGDCGPKGINCLKG